MRRKFDASFDAGQVILGGRRYKVEVFVEGFVSSPSDLDGTVKMSDIETTPPTKELNGLGEETYTPELTYSFKGIERLVNSYQNAKDSLARMIDARGYDGTITAREIHVEVSPGVMTLWKELASWHWGYTDYRKMFHRGPHWLTVDIVEADVALSHFSKIVEAIQRLPKPHIETFDAEDEVQERQELERERLETAFHQAQLVAQYGREKPATGPIEIPEDETNEALY